LKTHVLAPRAKASASASALRFWLSACFAARGIDFISSYLVIIPMFVA
jgi:hypothetical protein